MKLLLSSVITRNLKEEETFIDIAFELVSNVFNKFISIEIQNIELMSAGVSSRNFKVIDIQNSQYVVRLEYFRSFEELEDDLLIVKELNNADVKVQSIPIVMVNWNGFPISIRKYIEGISMENIVPSQEMDCYNAGRSLAKIHLLTTESERMFFYNWIESIESVELFNEELCNNTIEIHDQPFQELAISYIKEFLNKTPSGWDSFPKGLIHVDYKHNNILINNSNLIILDFEKSCYHCLLFDFCLSLFHFYASPTIGSLNNAKTFFCGYEDIRELSKLEHSFGLLATKAAAAIFFLTDLYIYTKSKSIEGSIALDHTEYYHNYCRPSFLKLINNNDDLNILWS